MAIKQKLKGEQNKTYDVLVNFNKGIDRRTADDVSDDRSFRKLTNFWNEKEGNLSKRPGLYDFKFTTMVQHIWNSWAPGDGYRFCDKSIVSDVIPYSKFELNLNTLKSIFCNLTLFRKYLYPDYVYGEFTPTDILLFQVLKDDDFHTVLENYDFSEGATNVLGENGLPSSFELNATIIVGGTLKGHDYTFNPGGGGIDIDFESSKGLFIWKIHMYGSTDLPNIIMDIDSVSCLDNNGLAVSSDEKTTVLWKYDIDFKKPMRIASYNGFTYITTGTDYIIKIMDEFPDSVTYTYPLADMTHNEYTRTEQTEIITQIGGLANIIYKPTPVEVSNIGFNILAKDPLTYIDTGSGSTDAIKGIYYSVPKNGSNEPIASIPPNAPFNITILSTGSGNLGTPQYRKDNGDTDTTTNPYKSIPGSYTGNTFNCTGLNFDGRLEIKITKGSSEFISYVSTGSAYNQETGLVQDIKKLVFSSTNIKVIGNQLVLFGGHGYIFFSEYDNFKYFPNYFFLYITSEAGEEEVTNIKYFRQYYAVFTNKRIKRMTGSFGSNDFGIYPLSDFVGCPNGDTIQQVNNNLVFLNIDGLYKLKQGYIGEGTENVEKIDDILGNELSSNNVTQSFVLGNFYIMVRNDKNSLTIYDFYKDSFFEFDLEETKETIKYNPKLDPDKNMEGDMHIPTEFEYDSKNKSYGLCFQNLVFDEHGSSIYIPEYHFTNNYISVFDETYGVIIMKSGLTMRCLRLSDLSFINEEDRHKDGIGFISELETPKLNMGSPTNTKKFKEIYIKMINDNDEAIPLYITIYIDDVAYISPEDYEVKYDADTNTYYYIYKKESNAVILQGAEILKAQEVLGTLTLGEDKLGQNTVYQLKIKINKKGRTIKIKLSDGYNDYDDLIPAETTSPTQTAIVTYRRYRNIKNFSIIAMGIVYKLKKVKEG